MSVRPGRLVATLIAGIVAAVLSAAAALIRAGTALADSDSPPPETTSHTGTLVVVGCITVAVILVALIVLRRIARSRKNKLIYEEYVNEREASTTRADQPRRPRDGGGA